MHCAACWEHLEQKEDLQDQAVSRIHRFWEILQARMVAPISEEGLAVTDKTSLGRYPCFTGVQSQGNVWSSTVELLWLTSIHASHTNLLTHAHMYTCACMHTQTHTHWPQFTILLWS